MRYVIFAIFLFVIVISKAIEMNTIKEIDEIEQLEKLAIANDNDAQYQLGELYYTGLKVDRSYQIALKWFIKAGENNNLNAQLKVAEMYENGKGIFGDIEESMKWYEKASSKSNIAKYKLGCFLFNKNIDDEKAIQLLSKAGDEGIADAYCVLGRGYYYRYYSGNKLEGDDIKSIKFYEKAVKMNDIEAIYMRNLSMYNIQEMVTGLRKSSEYGLGNAFYMIYFCYCYQGNLFKSEISRIEAYKSMLIAEKLLGHNIRVEQKVTIDKFNFTKEEIEEATKQANEWKPKPLPPQPVVK